MKDIIMLRHGRKDGELIAEDQITDIVNNGIPAINDLVRGRSVVIHYGSSFVRTKQTIQAFEKYADKENLFQKTGFYIRGDSRFGNPGLFADMTAKTDVVAQKTTWYQAFMAYNPRFITKVQLDLMAALRKFFSLMEAGQVGITIGHTPMIEWLAFAIAPERAIPRNTKLDELTGFIFTEEDDGRISVQAKVEPI